VWGKSASPRSKGESTRLVALGAIRERLLYDGNDSCIAMQDIEGNEFCAD
jgi:hypothetical protein